MRDDRPGSAYGVRVTRAPLHLAALASAAVPGLDPVSVEAVGTDDDHPYDVAFVQDTQHRRWVVRAPRTPAASAQMEQAAALLGLLAHRAPFGVPLPTGFAATGDGTRTSVHAYIPGMALDLARLPPGPGIAAHLGRTIALVHNCDRAIFDEAGLPSYDAEEYRSRRLAALDRAAASGRVPAGLLTRWEHALEDVGLWRFAPVPVHGSLTGGHVLARFPDEHTTTGTVKALTGWEHAKVADPADDFAALVEEAVPDAVDTVMEAYAQARVDRPDRHLLVRARLVSELRHLGRLMSATAAGDRTAADRHAAALRALDERVNGEGSTVPDLVPQHTAVRRPPPVVNVESAGAEDTAAEDTSGAEDAPTDTDPSNLAAPDPTGADPTGADPADADRSSEGDAVAVETDDGVTGTGRT